MSENHPDYALDTDARSQAPTFDEMVAMIEKLFKDYLKDIRKNALTDEQIEEGWQRYKTFNHLYQDEQPKPAGAVWVPCSQMPIDDSWEDYPRKYILCGHNDGRRGDVDIHHVTYEEMKHVIQAYDWCEWLDESGTAPTELPTFWDVAKAFKWASEYGNEQGEQLLLTEDGQWLLLKKEDGVTETDELTSGNVAELYCLQNGFDKENGTASNNDAIEFAEWAPTIAFFDEDTRLWELLREGEFINGQFRFTTKELYTVFKQQKGK